MRNNFNFSRVPWEQHEIWKQHSPCAQMVVFAERDKLWYDITLHSFKWVQTKQNWPNSWFPQNSCNTLPIIKAYDDTSGKERAWQVRMPRAAKFTKKQQECRKNRSQALSLSLSFWWRPRSELINSEPRCHVIPQRGSFCLLLSKEREKQEIRERKD